MGRKIGAGVAGVFVAIVLVWLIEMIGHSIYPPPADLDTGDMDVMRAYVDAVPLGALLSVAIAWFVGSVGGTFTACRIGPARPLVYVLVVGGFMFAGAAVNLTIIPHPLWFSLLGVTGIFAGTWLGMALAIRKD
jgi:hypothetical protein